MNKIRGWRKTRRATFGVAVLVILGSIAGVFIIGAVGAVSAPAAPSITSGPSGNVATTGATFKYSSSTSGVTYVCSLDSGSYKACNTTGVTYTGLSNGSHTFRVEAKKNNTTSSATARTWTVDTTGPTISGTFPANLHTYGTATWNAGCAAGPGICGTATDPSGVASVRVGVLSLSTLRYWNGSSFSSGGQFLLTANGTTSWRLPMPVPPSGFYGVLVSATDSLGNVRSVAQILLFTTNTTAPPTPTITSKPAASTALTSATFKFTDTKSGVTFKCSRDGATAERLHLTDHVLRSHCKRPLVLGGRGRQPRQHQRTGFVQLDDHIGDSAGASRTFDHGEPGVDHDAAGRDLHVHRHAIAGDIQVRARRRHGHGVHVGHQLLEPGRDRSLLHGGRAQQPEPGGTGDAVLLDDQHGSVFDRRQPRRIVRSRRDVSTTACRSRTPTTLQSRSQASRSRSTDATTKNGNPNPACVGSQNLVVSQAFTGTVTVGPNATVTVPSAQAPKLTMPNLSTDQSTCKGTTFQISYTGTATL